jgi:thioredoxin reductase (NADPH)
MALQLQSIREQRRDQMYPAFDPTEIERVRKFGKVRSFAGGERLWTAGQVAPGLIVVLAGSIPVTQHDQFDNEEPIGILRPGNFLGELAQLSGRPALVDAIAQEPAQALSEQYCDPEIAPQRRIHPIEVGRYTQTLAPPQ